MYGRENYEKIKNLIEERRKSAIAEADARNLEVSALSEDIRLIDKELRGTGLLLFKTACSGGDITPIRERNQMLCKAREDALEALGLPRDYTEPHYSCNICRDSGYVGTKMCSCFREMLITENIKSSGMGRLIEKQSFENFSLERYKNDKDVYSRMQKILDAAKSFSENFGNGQNLLFMGKTGTGKTHISTAIAKSVIEKGFEVLYDSSQNIVSAFEQDRFKSGYSPSYEPLGNKYLECDLLILDDLGTEFVNQFTVSCLYNLLNTRYNKGLSTIISTNLSADELLNKYEDRIYSRIVGADTRVLMFLGDDYRISR